MLIWVLVGYLTGAVVILFAEVARSSRWHGDELLALVFWPLVIPVVGAWGWVRNKRRTCPECKKRYIDRAAMLRHRYSLHRDTQTTEGGPE